MFGKKKEKVEEIYNPKEDIEKHVHFHGNFAVWNYYSGWDTKEDLCLFLSEMEKKGYIPMAPLGDLSYFIFMRKTG